MTSEPRRSTADSFERQSARRGFLHIVTGTAAGQLVTFFALPVLSRIYGAHQFGALTFALAIAGAVVPLALLGFDQAVIQPRDDKNVWPIAVTAIFSLTVASAVVAFLVLFTPFASSAGAELTGYLAWALPLLVLISGAVALLSQFAVRTGRYSSIGNRNSVQSVAITGAQLSFAGTAKASTFSGLLTGTLIGSAVGAVLLVRFARPFARRVHAKECLGALRRYWRFPLIFAPMTSLTLLAQQTAALFAVLWFGSASGGQVGMAERIVAVPLALIGLAAGSVFSGELSHRRRSEQRQMTTFYLRTSLWLGILSVVVALLLFFLAPLLFPLFLGPGWREAGLIAQSMALVAATRMLANPLRSSLRVMERARTLTIIELSRAALLAVGIGLTITLQLDLLPSLMVLYGGMALADIATWICGLEAVRRADREQMAG